MVIEAYCVEPHEPFLKNSVGKRPETPSSTMQMKLRERFDLSVSISQINRVRAALGVSNHPKSQQQGKKRQAREALSLTQSGMLRKQLLTLLFLQGVGLRRTWDETKLHRSGSGLTHRSPPRLWLPPHRAVLAELAHVGADEVPL